MKKYTKVHPLPAPDNYELHLSRKIDALAEKINEVIETVNELVDRDIHAAEKIDFEGIWED
jgi:hypothetical protein